MKLTNILIKGKRPGQTEFAYYNRFPEDNAAINGNPDPDRARERLMMKAETTKTFWLNHEPEGTLIVVENEAIGKPQPIKARDERQRNGAPFLTRKTLGRRR